ncbi:hypothetical protein BT96DRAFT_939298 [Gymnopus androsaceus JB14]|uniref:Uncharacterized protein n=1 Tax=Gymnopus androsaceus JB14 TaxID=1447944 RepID=A0A6A4HQI9_9AGAR|nr:hypothetical protein BT96DRAFT_939298 [Gymnopus androsaceus JB14]
MEKNSSLTTSPQADSDIRHRSQTFSPKINQTSSTVNFQKGERPSQGTWRATLFCTLQIAQFSLPPNASLKALARDHTGILSFSEFYVLDIEITFSSMFVTSAMQRMDRLYTTLLVAMDHEEEALDSETEERNGTSAPRPQCHYTHMAQFLYPLIKASWLKDLPHVRSLPLFIHDCFEFAMAGYLDYWCSLEITGSAERDSLTAALETEFEDVDHIVNCLAEEREKRHREIAPELISIEARVYSALCDEASSCGHSLTLQFQEKLRETAHAKAINIWETRERERARARTKARQRELAAERELNGDKTREGPRK